MSPNAGRRRNSRFTYVNFIFGSQDHFNDILPLFFQLEKFTHSVQRLGSALGLSRASLEFHRALKSVREYFEQNSRDLLGIVLKKLEVRTRRPIRSARRKRRKRKEKSQYGGSLAYTYQNDLSEHLDELYAALEKFSIAVSDFEEYVDNDGAIALRAFMTEIKVSNRVCCDRNSVPDNPIGSF